MASIVYRLAFLSDFRHTECGGVRRSVTPLR